MDMVLMVVVLLVVMTLVLVMAVDLLVVEFCVVMYLWQQQRRHPVPNRTPFEHQQQVQCEQVVRVCVEVNGICLPDFWVVVIG